MKDRNPIMAKRALAAGRGQLGDGKTRARHDFSKMQGAMTVKRTQRKVAQIDELEKYTYFDFVERYEGIKGDHDEAVRLWFVARAGKFPPWGPTTSRGQPAVAKLAPEKVQRSRAEVEEQSRGSRKRKARDPAGKSLSTDGMDLLPGEGEAIPGLEPEAVEV